MASVAVKYPAVDDALLVQLAREIAMDVVDIDAILKRYEVSPQTWERIQANKRFDEILKSAITEWQSAINTEQRIKVKSSVLIEEWLSEANSRLHDRTESLAAKTELAKLLARFANIALTGANTSDATEKFTVTINLGGDSQLKFTKELPVRVIEHDPTPQET